jgi:hypothetical protein
MHVPWLGLRAGIKRVKMVLSGCARAIATMLGRTRPSTASSIRSQIVQLAGGTVGSGSDNSEKGLRMQQAGFDRGATDAHSRRTRRCKGRVHGLRRKIERLRADGAELAEINAALAEFKAINKERWKVFRRSHGPQLQRLRYCRYADDSMIGIIGTKAPSSFRSRERCPARKVPPPL